MERNIFDVNLNQIEVHPEVLKMYEKKDLEGLKLTMQFAGQLEPIKVVQDGLMYPAFDGVSRYYAAKELGWSTMTVEVVDLTPDQLKDQSVLRNYRTKRSYTEIIRQAEMILGILGQSQGKRRQKIGDSLSLDTDFCLAGKDRFELACDILGVEFSARTLRRLMKVNEVITNSDNPEVKQFDFLGRIERGEMKINSACAIASTYEAEKAEQNTNALTDTLNFLKTNNALQNIGFTENPITKEFINPSMKNEPLTSTELAVTENVVRGEHFTLYNKDCNSLEELADESVDLAMFSPPYYKQRTYPDGVMEAEIQIGAERTPDEYIKRTVHLYSRLLRVLKQTGSLAINVAESYEGESCLITAKLVVAMCNAGWSLQSEWIWKKANQKPQRNIKRLLPTYEKIFVFVKNPKEFYFRDFKNWQKDGSFKLVHGGNDGDMGTKRTEPSYTLTKPYKRFRDFLDEQQVMGVIESTVFQWSELNEIDPNYRHMAPFPSTIPLLPILMMTKPGDTVLDIFSGTGTTATVAVQLGRNAIGFDTDTVAHKFAVKRLQFAEKHLPSTNEVLDFEQEYLLAS